MPGGGIGTFTSIFNKLRIYNDGESVSSGKNCRARKARVEKKMDLQD